MWGREAALRIFPRSPHRPEGLGQRVCGQRGNPRLHQRILLSTRSALGPVPHCVPTQTVTEPPFPGTRGRVAPELRERLGNRNGLDCRLFTLAKSKRPLPMKLLIHQSGDEKLRVWC